MESPQIALFWEQKRHIGQELARIGERIKAGDESKLALWVIPGKLVCAQRPLGDHPDFGGYHRLPLRAKPMVAQWVDRVQSELGVRSIICLLQQRDLDYYYVNGGVGLHRGGLLGFYASRGLSVSHQPMKDYKPPEQRQLDLVLEAFAALPKPVLVHCGAGIDRTTPTAAFIACQQQTLTEGGYQLTNLLTLQQRRGDTGPRHDSPAETPVAERV